MLGVDMIVDHMNVSRTTLFNKMNNLVGASTNKYIRRIRIDVAKEMLSKTNKSVGTIAEETGFSESQYFSTVFKQETGMTPSQFKDSLRKL
jgi:AraC-like DNA-binding protein